MEPLCSPTFYEVLQPFKFMKTHPQEMELDPLSRVPIKPSKISDVLSLLPFLAVDNRNFYINYFEKEQTAVGLHESGLADDDEQESDASYDFGGECDSE